MVSDDIRERVTSYIKHQGTKSPDALIELVSTSQGRFLDTIAEVSDEAAVRKPAADEWSLLELILHVIQAEGGVARLVAMLARGESLENTRRAAGAMMDHDGRAFAQYVAQLRETNGKMLDAVRGLPESPNITATAPHPFFGPLNCVEWAAFQRVHDEDHIQHARKIIAAVRA